LSPPPSPVGLGRSRLTTLGVRLLTSVAYVISVLLALAILSPVAVSFWGAMTTSKAMGTASEVGPGWQATTTTGSGVFAEAYAGADRFFHLAVVPLRNSGCTARTILFTLQLAVVSVVITTLIGVAASYVARPVPVPRPGAR